MEFFKYDKIGEVYKCMCEGMPTYTCVHMYN